MDRKALRVALRTVAVFITTVVVLVTVVVMGPIRLTAQSKPPPVNLSQLATRVAPSLVSIKTTIFRDGTSEGFGFFYGKPGHILTSAHVLARATSAEITDASGNTYGADLEGIDRSIDVAELSTADTTPKPLRAATAGVSVGSHVVVIGNPYGILPNKATHGLVADTNRQLTIDGKSYANMIQTDALASPGNSGGPVVNMAGQLVGMVAAGGSGYTFAIPSRLFVSQVAGWQASATFVRLGPPLVSATAQSLVLPSPEPGWTGSASEKWSEAGWHSVWRKAPDYDYGGAAMDIYINVTTDESSAKTQYPFHLETASKRGYTGVGAVSGLGDESTAFERIVADQVTYQVVFRDRNVVVIMYLGSGMPPRPDISMAALRGMATAQARSIGADLAGYQ